MSGHTEYKRLQETDLEEGLTAVELQGRDVDGKTVAVPLYDISGKENTSNKVTTLTNNDTDYPTTKAVTTELNKKVSSVTTGEPTGAIVIGNFIGVTQAQHTAGPIKSTTFYVILDA